MAKKIFACLLIIALILCAGCKPNETGVPAGVVAPIKSLALITGDKEIELDHAYVAIYEGLINCCTANNINYSFYMPDDMSEESLTQQFEYAATDGATVILCMGEVFSPVIKTMQDKYPEVKIIAMDVPASSIGTLNKNTHTVMFRQEQGGYISGYSAVKDGFTKLAYIGDHPSEAYTSYANGFIKGINDAAVELQVQVSVEAAYISDFADSNDAFKHVTQWYKNGYDLVMVSADEDFTYICAQAAVENLGYLIGTDTDQSHIGAYLDYNPFITSSMIGIREAVDTTLEHVLSGAWDSELGGKTLYFGLQNGNYIYLPEYEATWLFSGMSLDEYFTLKNSIATGAVMIDGTALPQVNSEFVTLTMYTPPADTPTETPADTPAE